MAKFEIAYKITKANEGGYNNDPTDTGGETYKGIARKYHPSWQGWKIVDEYKKSLGGKLARNTIIPNPLLDMMVTDFYKAKFWKPIEGDKINNQQMANLIFDFGVNGNHTTVISFVERIVNGLGFKMQVDGKIDPTVLSWLNSEKKEEIYKRLKERIKNYYQQLSSKDPEKYGNKLQGWLNRLKRFPETIDDFKKKD